MKKFWVLLISLGLLCGLLKSPNIYAAEGEEETEVVESEQSEVQEPEQEEFEEIEIFESTVVIKDSEGGVLLSDILEGHVGDVVTLKVIPGILYELDSIYVNNIKLEANEEGIYQFVLVDGENVVTYTFIVSDAKVEEIAKLLDKVRNKDWENIFTLDNFLIFMQWVITTFCSGGFFITLMKLKKNKSMTIEDLNNNVNTNVRKDVNSVVESTMTNVIAPILSNVLEAIGDIKNITNVLTRCTILSQENTPESRLAILKELENVNKDQEELTNTVKSLINQEIKKNNEAVEERNKALDDLKKTNNESEAPHL